MMPGPPRSTRTSTLVPNTTPCRSIRRVRYSAGDAAEPCNRDQQRVVIEPIAGIEGVAELACVGSAIVGRLDRAHLDQPERRPRRDQAGGHDLARRKIGRAHV